MENFVFCAVLVLKKICENKPKLKGKPWITLGFKKSISVNSHYL